jgi:hypothetical protein
MEFRWIALLTLWTLLSGPVLVRPFMSSPFASRAVAPVPTAPR